MPNQYTKLSVQQSLNTLATLRAIEAMQTNGGRALPCRVTAVSGSIVTVAFEVQQPYMQADGTMSTYTLPPLTLPKAESQWLRAPTQVGDFGVTRPVDTFVGRVSGLGSGTANTGTNYGNMTTLVWEPVGNVDFSAAPDPNKAWINGPAGAVVSDHAQTAVLTVAANLVTIAAESGTVQLQGSGTEAADAIVRQADLQTAVNALIAAVDAAIARLAATVEGGAGVAPQTVAAVTVTGSAKSFSG